MAKPVIWTVDDDPDVLRAVERDLRRQYGDRYKVISADSGSSALEAVKQLKLRNEQGHRFIAQFQLFYGFKGRGPGIRRDDLVTIAILPAQIALHRSQYVRIVVHRPNHWFSHRVLSGTPGGDCYSRFIRRHGTRSRLFQVEFQFPNCLAYPAADGLFGPSAAQPDFRARFASKEARHEHLSQAGSIIRAPRRYPTSTRFSPPPATSSNLAARPPAPV